MVFNKNIDGLKNEDEFVDYLSGKQVYQLNPMFKELINNLYKNIKDDDFIYAYKLNNKDKTDFVILINGEFKNISLKKGVKNSVHLEPLSKFIDYLNFLNIDDNIINMYLEYHYADGTIDGSGTNRQSSEEYKSIKQKDIDIINKAFNKTDILERVYYRFILKGIHGGEKVDAIIFGVVDDFIFANRYELEDVFLSHLNDYSTAPHFGPVTIQPWNRCLNNNSKYEKCRDYIQVKWYNLADDIIYIMSFIRKRRNQRFNRKKLFK